MVRLLRAAALKLIGEQAMGALDVVRRPYLRSGWGSFNGQPFRRDLFKDVIELIKPIAIVETGTSYGLTTEFMAQTKLPIFTVEEHPRRYGFARANLWRQRNVKLLHQDSRSGLRTLLDGPLAGLTSRPLFFY